MAFARTGVGEWGSGEMSALYLRSAMDSGFFTNQFRFAIYYKNVYFLKIEI
ncbi:hypothetical protein CYANOKiyG1_70660 [Okeania sp. KiyG1]|nr:hypothetical protein CYANOKiyG1_70660 [Okeania sp. KiyG1]